jgi:beta-glucosidase
MDERIEALLAQLTLEEKISLLAGADMWHTVAIERLGIPAIKVTDGPLGARGVDEPGSPTSACFPGGVALAATWNVELAARIGKALAEETKSKGAHILLAPTVNIQRSPLAGRNFECFSEDPFLTSRMAVAYINGLQSESVGACIKHFVCNDSEFERFSMSSEVGERALREIYLRPFEVALREAKPWAVMSAYNRINGTYASENDYTLRDILKGEWGFDGIVMSDWFGTYSPKVVKGGLDLEMPGPARWMGKPALEAAQHGVVGEEHINDKVRRLLRTIFRVGAFVQPESRAEQAVDQPEQRQLAREAAGEAVVLLKNDDAILPLDPGRVKTIAVIGPNAQWASIMGGGSARVWPHYVVSPLEGIRRRAGHAQVRYTPGCLIFKRPPLFDAAWLRAGLEVAYFANRELAGEPVYTTVTRKMEWNWPGKVVPHAEAENFSVRFSGEFAVPDSGTYRFNLSSVGKARLLIDGKDLINLWDDGAPSREQDGAADRELSVDRTYALTVEYATEPGLRWRSIRLGCLPPLPSNPLAEAVALAEKADVAIVFAGLTSEWESEGFDRPDMELPGAQTLLIERVSAANPNTIVLLNAGAPLTMNWLDRVKAVLQAWYLGQETGTAIADVLFGDVNPSGKLPTTFPRRLQDNPAYLNYPGENGKVVYGEGLYVGYRYYDRKDIPPLFPFGYGLSYTAFAYRKLGVDVGAEIHVSVEVQNTGARAGKEIVQLYVRDVESRLARPEKELKGFAKVALRPGEAKTVTFTLDVEALSYYDPSERRWVAEAGEFEVLVGSSSRDIRLKHTFDLPPNFPPKAGTGEAAHGLAIKHVAQ